MWLVGASACEGRRFLFYQDDGQGNKTVKNVNADVDDDARSDKNARKCHRRRRGDGSREVETDVTPYALCP